MKTLKYVILYLLLIEVMIPHFVPQEIGYNDRMNYAMVKDNTGNIDIILDQIKHEIDRKGIRDYIVLLGDSVAYSGPGPASQSIGPAMEAYYRENGQRNIIVFNLAMPAMQVGDIYTMLLKLDEHGISSDHLIFNVIYAGFTKRVPDPPIVFWLQKDLKRLDPAAYQFAKPELIANQWLQEDRLPEKVNHAVTSRLAIFRYKDFVKTELISRYNRLRGIQIEDALGDNRPWREKEGLRELLQTEPYRKGYSTAAFDMTRKNPQVYFLNKIAVHQQGKQTLIFMAPVNPELMEQVKTPEYQENLNLAAQCFSALKLPYIDFHGQIDQSLFTDHVHLTSEGYDLLARKLAENFATGD